MTADSGLIKAWFAGSQSDLERLNTIMDTTDRQNLFSCGLSWLDDVDSQWEVESEAISYDSMEATREFLTQVLNRLPQLQFEGSMEHCWPAIPRQITQVTFFSEDGKLHWEETTGAAEEEPDPYGLAIDPEEFDPEEIEIPLTPYDA